MKPKRIFILVSLACGFGTLLLFTGILGGVSSVRSSANDIEVSPAHKRETTPGQIETYDHLLTNNMTDTHTFYLEAQSSQGWPVELLGVVSPSETLQVDGLSTVPFQVQLTIPMTAGGLVDVTIITATAEISPAIWATTVDTTTVASKIYLPIVFNDWPPIPYRPAIYAISGAEDGNFAVGWTEAPSRRADSYILQEAADVGFTSGVRTVCSTSSQSCTVMNKLAGSYYYRVRGSNVWGTSEWSASRSANVLLPAVPYLNPIDNSDGDGNYVVDWNVSARAATYVLEQATNSNFSNFTTLYSGASTYWSVNNQGAGTFYYRVIAKGSTGSSAPSNTRSATVIPPPSTSGDVRITNIFYDGSGSQEPDEYVQIKNYDSNTIQLKNWTLRDNANHVFTFPTFLMIPGQVCRIYTNQWQSSWCNFNYQNGAAIWNNGGDCAILRNSTGTQIDKKCY